MRNSKSIHQFGYILNLAGFYFLFIVIGIIEGWTIDVKEENKCLDEKNISVSYGIAVESFQEQKPLIFSGGNREADVNNDQRYIAPVVVRYDEQFWYTYDLLSDTPLSLLKLSMNYRDGEVEGLLGKGWKVVFTFFIGNELTHDVLSPDIGVFGYDNKWSLYIEGDQIPVQMSIDDNKELYTTKPNSDSTIYIFQKIMVGKELLIIPYRIKENKSEITFRYSISGGLPLLERVYSDRHIMDFNYEQQDTSRRLVSIILSPVTSNIEGPLKQWVFIYDKENVGFLREISIEIKDRNVTRLQYSYCVPETGRETIGLHSIFEGEVSSLWERGDPWELPGRWSLSRNKGLRFFEIDKYKPIDLVNVKERGLKSWVWDKQNAEWIEYSVFAPKRKLLNINNTPAGSQFTNIWKFYPKNVPAKLKKHSTNGYQSIVNSYYLPGPDGKLEYHSEVCFPNIICKAGRCIIAPDSNGNIWDCDTNQVLQLPFPLQYEGTRPWPEKTPGVRPREEVFNQGAQFVPFGPYRNGLHFFAIWLRYIDEKTDEPLLGEHRYWYPQNIHKRYSTKWNYAGGKKNVRVEICQAFWGKRGLRWSEADKGKEQWLRMDIDRQTGLPNGNYILPWHGRDNPNPKNRDPNFNYHYEGFRNVSFANLEPRKNYAIIHGRSCDNCTIENRRPAGRHIYQLKNRKWIEVGKHSGFYSPGEVFEAKNLMFVDINNDGYDDIIQIDRRPAKVYINIKKLNKKNAWQECPPLQLPHECNLLDDCRLMSLDGDGDNDLDLFVGNGKITFYNLSTNKGKRPTSYMTFFTDENGKERSVIEYLPALIDQ